MNQKTMSLLLCLLAFSTYSAAEDAKLLRLDTYIDRAVKDWEVPGLAIAIVKDDSVVFAKGYGVRKLGAPEPVIPGTVFAIASCTKAFTTACLSMLVDEGKIKWDDPVIKYLPTLQFEDPYITYHITIRDLISHKGGFSNWSGDVLWIGMTYSREDVVNRVRYLKSGNSFRERFVYQNVPFVIAGQVILAVTGRTWDECVAERIFKSLGMASSSTRYADLVKNTNLALPHQPVDGVFQPISYDNVDTCGPAGSINSNVLDLAQWMRLQLGRGVYKGKRLYSEETAKEMWTPQVIVPTDVWYMVWTKLNPPVNFFTYGFGWFVEDYHGGKCVYHGGSLTGISTEVALLPEKHLGVVILSNKSSFLTTALRFRVFDEFLGFEPRDWSTEFRTLTKPFLTTSAKPETKAASVPAEGPKPSLPLDAYAGMYTEERIMFGDAAVTMKDGSLFLQLVPAPSRRGVLKHVHYDTFQVEWERRTYGNSLVTFALDKDGKVDRMQIEHPNLLFKKTSEKDK